jgi:hypothetical protein
MRLLYQGTEPVDFRIEYDGSPNDQGFEHYTETNVVVATVTDGGVLIFEHANGSVSAASPTGWTQVGRA